VEVPRSIGIYKNIAIVLTNVYLPYSEGPSNRPAYVLKVKENIVATIVPMVI
jgi:hypothetical protein